MQPLKKAESFQIIEERPSPTTPHPDQKIQDAVKPALLVMDANGKVHLLYEID